MKSAVLVVSFGTTYMPAKENNIDRVVNYIAEKFPNYDVFEAYTSVIIRKKLMEKGINIDDVKTAIEKIIQKGYKKIIVVSLHLIAGHEYENKILKVVNLYKDKFEKIAVTTPMLYDEEDYEKVASIIDKIYKDIKEPIVLMGHGSDHKNDIAYEKLQLALDNINKDRYYIATVEGEITIDEIVSKLKEKNIKKVSLSPFMLVCGEHAHNDMAGDEEDSWLNILKSNNIEVNVILKGLGEYISISEYFAKKILRKSID